VRNGTSPVVLFFVFESVLVVCADFWLPYRRFKALFGLVRRFVSLAFGIEVNFSRRLVFQGLVQPFVVVKVEVLF
jgi:hypothetical protein